MTAMKPQRTKRAYHRRPLMDTAAPVSADTSPRYIAPDPEVTQTATIERPSARPVAREEDPRARAAARAAQLRDRGVLNADDSNEFNLPHEMQPDGWEYEWKRLTLINQEDPSYQVQLAQRGWDPVPASRHPQLMPTDYSGSTITNKGMILMERPKEINDEARRKDFENARGQVVGMEEKLMGAPPGTMERRGAKVNKSYEPVVIPAD